MDGGDAWLPRLISGTWGPVPSSARRAGEAAVTTCEGRRQPQTVHTLRFGILLIIVTAELISGDVGSKQAV